MAKVSIGTVRLPKHIHDKLEAVKECYGSSHSFVIEKALELYFDENVEMVERAQKKRAISSNPQ